MNEIERREISDTYNRAQTGRGWFKRSETSARRHQGEDEKNIYRRLNEIERREISIIYNKAQTGQRDLKQGKKKVGYYQIMQGEEYEL